MTKMKENLSHRWRDGANLLLGLWLIVSPWLLGYAGHQMALWNALVPGVIIAVAACAAIVAFHEWEEWVNMALGAWLVVAPWVLDFAAQTAAVWNHVVVGVIVAVLAIWSVVAAREEARQTT